jgi:hypothetical protein
LNLVNTLCSSSANTIQHLKNKTTATEHDH